jgi:hypothetical protein
MGWSTGHFAIILAYYTSEQLPYSEVTMGGFSGISYDLHGAAPADYERLNGQLAALSFKKSEVNTFWTIALGEEERVEKMFADAAKAAGIGRYTLITMGLSEPTVRVLRKPADLLDALNALKDALQPG